MPSTPPAARPPRRPVEYDNSYPRYDRALGVTLESEQHRRQICKERGLVPLETRFNDVTSDYKAEKRRQAELDKAADDYIRELNESTAPEFVGARIARDRGQLMDWNDSTDKIRTRRN